MGMYTEIIIKTDIRPDITDKEREILNYLFNGGEFDNPPMDLPDHEFFTLSRWKSIGSCSSYYHIPWSCSKYHEDYLFSRSDLKNYDSEIEAFFDWLDPLCNVPEGTCIGWSWYGENESPILIYKKGVVISKD